MAAMYNEFLGVLITILSAQLLYKYRGSIPFIGGGKEKEVSASGGGGGDDKVGSAAANAASSSCASSRLFAAFQRQFIIVYLVMMMADWMQGALVYALYAHYGFTREQNAQLFIAGFGSSLVFGTWAGPLADKYGRRFCCLMYGISYTLSCATKHSRDFNVLLVGRLLGGFATSILWSAFESWMISEHKSRKFPDKDIDSTFGLMYTLNGLVAIASGFVAQYAVYLYGGHPVAPFDASALLLIAGSAIIYSTWPENYGDEAVPLLSQFKDGFAAIQADRGVFTVGLMQALFEGAMYTFVFLWTPALDDGTGKIPHGLIFASFMTASSLGGSLFGLLIGKFGAKKVMVLVFLGAASAMSIPVLMPGSDNMIMLGFICFEIIVGIFWPCIGSLRATYVPENCRATVTNIFRIPLNIIVCCVLMAQGQMSVAMTFGACTLLHGAGLFVALQFNTVPDPISESQKIDTANEAPSAVAE